MTSLFRRRLLCAIFIPACVLASLPVAVAGDDPQVIAELRRYASRTALDADGYVKSVELPSGHVLFNTVVALVKLRRLESLDLGRSQIDDRELSWIARLTTLKTLKLSDTKADLGSWARLKTLRKLEALYVPRSFSDAHLATLPRLPQLTLLYLRGSTVSDAGLVGLTNVPNLLYLDLCGTEVGDDATHPLRSLSKLQGLDLSGTKFSDAGVPGLLRLKGLVSLDLRSTNVTDYGMRSIASLRRLRGLAVPPRIGDLGLQSLAKMPQLEQLNLSNSKATDAGLESLQNLKNLRFLYLCNTRVTDRGLPHIIGLVNLRQLHINETLITPQGQLALEKALPQTLIIGPLLSRQ